MTQMTRAQALDALAEMRAEYLDTLNNLEKSQAQTKALSAQIEKHQKDEADRQRLDPEAVLLGRVLAACAEFHGSSRPELYTGYVTQSALLSNEEPPRPSATDSALGRVLLHVAARWDVNVVDGGAR